MVQVIGAIAAAGLLLVIAKGQPGGYDAATSGLVANGYDKLSPAATTSRSSGCSGWPRSSARSSPV